MAVDDPELSAPASGSGEIAVVLNGEDLSIAAGLTVADLVQELGRDRRAVAVEHNGRILSRDRYEQTVINEGDRIEVVHFVQGG